MGFWDGESVLVTGSAGFIGSTLAERLVRSGARLRAMVHYNSRNDCGWVSGAPRTTPRRWRDTTN